MPRGFFCVYSNLFIILSAWIKDNKMKLKLLVVFLTLAVFNQSTLAADKNKSGSASLVIIKKFKFIPQEITIKRGQKVRWKNREKRQYHSVWFEALGEEEPEDYLFSGDTYDREFKKIGTFPYRCGPHPKMTGTVRVIE
jgi:plastocyanin